MTSDAEDQRPSKMLKRDMLAPFLNVFTDTADIFEEHHISFLPVNDVMNQLENDPE